MLFKSVIGQQATKQRLIKMVNDNRISHALMFFGTQGSGALPLAVAFAQYINCENKTDNDSCGVCVSCNKYQKLIHPDLHFALPVANTDKIKSATTNDFLSQWRECFIANPYMELNNWYEAIDIEKKQAAISVEESNAIIKKLSYKNFEAQYKVLIMWHADKMNVAASNKLLKIIEEPPDQTIFILISEQYENILPTIISRTQLVKIPQTDTVLLAEKIVADFALEWNKAKKIVHLSGNNYNTIPALVQMQQVTGDIEKSFIEWMRLCWNIFDNYKKVSVWTEEMAKEVRETQKNFLHFGLETARECLITNFAGAVHSRFDEQTYTGFEKFSKMLHQGNIQQFADEFNKAFFHIERNANAKILFLDLSFKMHRILRTKA